MNDPSTCPDGCLRPSPGVKLLPRATIDARVTKALREAEREQLRLNWAKIAWRWVIWVIALPIDRTYWRRRWQARPEAEGLLYDTMAGNHRLVGLPPPTFRQRVKLMEAPVVPDPDLF